jgi:4-hydroxy-tetrahydrodipicolinate reductase
MKKVKVGLIGHGKAGKAVAQVLDEDERYELCWVARQDAGSTSACVEGTTVPLISSADMCTDAWLDRHPVDAIVDFSRPEAVLAYGEQVRRRGLMLITANSAHTEAQLRYLQTLGLHARILASPNITLGINYLMVAAKLLRTIAPFADVAVLEQHFRDKPEVSGTARKIAEHLDLQESEITSLRLGGIVGHHEVIFGFPYQTVRLVHDSIRREAFGTGVAFALAELQDHPAGFYTFEDLLMKKLRQQMLAA